jgi:hypothetical protein
VAPGAREADQDHAHAEPNEFRRQLRDLYVPGDDVGLWQAAIRDPDHAEYADLHWNLDRPDPR